MKKKALDNWYELKNEGTTPELLIYGFIGQYDEVSFAGFAGAIKNLTTNALTVRIHSGGGSVFDGLPIYDALKASGLDITVIIDGLAASMASVISQVASKGKRKIQKSGNLMIHRVRGAEYGNSDEMRAYADMMDVQEKKIKSIFTEATGQTEEIINGWFTKGVDFWIDAENALKLGLVDEIIEGTTEKLPVNQLKNMGEKAAFEALTNSVPHFHLQNEQIEMNKLQVLLMAALAVRGITVVDNATEEQTAQAISNAFKGLDDKIMQLTNTIKDNATNQVDALIAKAKAEGKLKADDTESEKDLKDLATTNLAMAQKFIDKIPSDKKPDAVVINLGLGNSSKSDDKNDKANWSFKDWSQKDSAGLQNKKVTDPDGFAKLFEAEYGEKYEG